MDQLDVFSGLAERFQPNHEKKGGGFKLRYLFCTLCFYGYVFSATIFMHRSKYNLYNLFYISEKFNLKSLKTIKCLPSTQRKQTKRFDYRYCTIISTIWNSKFLNVNLVVRNLLLVIALCLSRYLWNVSLSLLIKILQRYYFYICTRKYSCFY